MFSGDSMHFNTKQKMLNATILTSYLFPSILMSYIYFSGANVSRPTHPASPLISYNISLKFHSYFRPPDPVMAPPFTKSWIRHCYISTSGIIPPSLISQSILHQRHPVTGRHIAFPFYGCNSTYRVWKPKSYKIIKVVGMLLLSYLLSEIWSYH